MLRRDRPDNRNQFMDSELARIREWAQDNLDAQHHIPWDSRRYQHLVVLIDEMLASRTQSCAGRRAGNIVDLDSARRPRRPARVRTSS
jgi:hypothetical protein